MISLVWRLLLAYIDTIATPSPTSELMDRQTNDIAVMASVGVFSSVSDGLIVASCGSDGLFLLRHACLTAFLVDLTAGRWRHDSCTKSGGFYWLLSPHIGDHGSLVVKIRTRGRWLCRAEGSRPPVIENSPFRRVDTQFQSAEVPTGGVAAVTEWYRYRIVACFVTGSSPVPLKTCRVGQRCTLNLSRAETSSRWCGVVVKRGGASSGVVHVT
ncbi:uncharacterized protein TNCV_2213901 [Trichonephila clavipes]|nr:uncharacterized protein TNCV_2213901 [Trichonephila clavipes]